MILTSEGARHAGSKIKFKQNSKAILETEFKYTLSLTEQIITRFCRWAQQRHDISGVFLVGSHARETASPTSDVDLVILTSEPQRYLEDFSWVSEFGDFNSIQHEDWGAVQSIRVFYKNGPEIEYGITTPDWASSPIPQSTLDVLAGGMKLLFDRSGMLAEAITGVPNSASGDVVQSAGGSPKPAV